MNLVEYCRQCRLQREENKESLLLEWHPKKNGTLQPEQVTPGSEKKVWWQCKEGHEWQAAVENRVLKGNGCPYCAGKRAWPGYNDLKTLYPKLAGQWHPTLNQGVSPIEVRPGSGKKIWWVCPDGHVWQARIFSRTSKNRSGCPVCAGNVKKRK